MSRGGRLRRGSEPTRTTNLDGIFTLNECADYIAEDKWPTIPDAVSDLLVSTGDQILNLSWSAPNTNGLLSSLYTIEYTPSDGSAVTVTTSNTSYQLTGLTNGTEYSIRVGLKVGNRVNYSVPVTATPDSISITLTNAQLRSDNTGSGYTGSPFRFEDTGGEVLVTFAVAGTLTFTFYDNDDGDTDYDIFPENHTGISGPHYNPFTQRWRFSGGGGPRTWTIKGSPELGTRIRYNGQTGYLRLVEMDLGDVPSIANFHASPNPQGALLLWTVADNGSPVTSWRVQYSSDEITWTTAYSESDLNLTSKTVAVTQPEIINGQTYYWRVIATNSNGDSLPSSSVAVVAGTRYIDTTGTSFTYTGVGTGDSRITGSVSGGGGSGETYPVYAPVNGTFFFRATTGDAAENDLYYPTNLSGGKSGRVNVSPFETSFDAVADFSGSMAWGWHGGGTNSYWFVPWVLDRSHTSFRGPGVLDYPMSSVTLTSTTRAFTPLISGTLYFTVRIGSDGGDSTYVRLEDAQGGTLLTLSGESADRSGSYPVVAGTTYQFRFHYGSNFIRSAYVQ